MFSKYVQPLLDLLFPPTCVGCGGGGSWLCHTCLSSARPMRLMRPTPEVDELVCLGAYDTPILSHAVQRLKYHGGQVVAEPLGHRLGITFRTSLTAGTLVPVPLHSSRLRERGFNQSELLAQAIGRATQRPVSQLVRRGVKTASQVTLDEAGRKENVADAFQIHTRLEKPPKHGIIVDDVFTTGATISAVARVLRTAGVRRISAITVAKG